MPKKDAVRGRAAITAEVAFGRALRTLRQSREMTQDELAAACSYHRTYIGILERGERSPTQRAIFDLSDTLGVRGSELVRATERERTLRQNSGTRR